VPPDEISRTYGQILDAYNTACNNVEARHKAIETAKDDPDTLEEERAKLLEDFTQAIEQRDRLYAELESEEKLEEARKQHRPMDIRGGRFHVVEPDIYTEHGDSFMRDLYSAQLKGDYAAQQRIGKHQEHELAKLSAEQQRAVSSGTLGGIIPPAYLIDLYAKASRNGRVFCDQVNGQPLPDVGMTVILPRLTVGLAAGSQASENSALTTQDPTEVDLTLNVRTIGGYSPVSRQGIERAAYSDRILFEDLIARYWAQLDTQALNGGGGSGTLLGLIQTSSIATSAATTITAAGVYPKIADVIQQISANVGGLGYLPDKIFMHPRRWGFFSAALDSQNRPLIVPGPVAYNPMGTADDGPGGVAGGYGYTGQQILGLPVYLDANIPTNLGTNTNEDRIVVCASSVVHLFERAGDPVTLSFEQQAGTSLQVQLIAYGYVAFTAGRYPGASGVVTGLTPPSF
jgi:HK97 family phage major capsid protein